MLIALFNNLDTLLPWAVWSLVCGWGGWIAKSQWTRFKAWRETRRAT